MSVGRDSVEPIIQSLNLWARRSLALPTKFSMAMSGASHFNHIALYVSDLKQSAEFYREVIGAEIIPDPFRDDWHVWLKIGEHNQLHLISGGPQPVPGNMHFAFTVPSVGEFAACLQKRGLQFDDADGHPNKIRLRPDGVKQIYFHDPDGYWIEVNDDRY